MQLLILAACVALASAGALPTYIPPQQRYNPGYYNQQYYNQANYQDLRPRAAADRNAAVLRSVSDVNENGYNFAYDTENGIHAEESGVEANGIQAQGVYSYTGDDGQVYSVRYTAGANGFEAQGSHLPTPPPIPEAIAKALQENARDEASGIFDDGSYHDSKYSPAVVAARNYQNRQYITPGFRNGFY